jgi:glycine/D-amino acid oxidase-like deaminating enzyme
MNRRELLASLGAAATFATYGRRLGAATPNHVVVIGAGILGASIGYHLAKRGARVTILEKARPASGATGDSFAYLNASTKPSRPYYELNLAGIAGWRRLQLELNGALPLQWGGAVYWRDEAAAATQLLTTLHGYQAWGYAGRQIDGAELHRILPATTPGIVEAAVFYDQEGTVDPADAVEVLLARARAFGAVVEYPVEVIGFDTTASRIRGVKTTRGKIEADVVILAAGLGSQPLAKLVNVKLPLTSSPGVLVHTTPQPALLGSVIFAPGNTLKQNPNGRIVSGGGHEGSNLTAPPHEQGEQILEDASRYLPKLKNATIETVSVGQRVLPVDGFPILGFLGGLRNLYVAATHSGVTLAPVIGQYVTQEVLDGVTLDPLAPYRPSRFSGI